jgi:hypothetical protein
VIGEVINQVVEGSSFCLVLHCCAGSKSIQETIVFLPSFLKGCSFKKELLISSFKEHRPKKRRVGLGVVAHACNPSTLKTGKLRQEDCKFEASLNNTVGPWAGKETDRVTKHRPVIFTNFTRVFKIEENVWRGKVGKT